MKNFFTFLFASFLFASFVLLSSVHASHARTDLHSFIHKTTLPGAAELRADSDEALSKLAESARLAESNAQWRRFSINLIQALKSSREGVQEAAMRYVIQYADNVNVSAAAIDVMRIYRNDSDINRRRMAVVTLGNMKSNWAFRFLERSAQFEKSEMVVKTILAVLAQENS